MPWAVLLVPSHPPCHLRPSSSSSSRSSSSFRSSLFPPPSFLTLPRLPSPLFPLLLTYRGGYLRKAVERPELRVVQSRWYPRQTRRCLPASVKNLRQVRKREVPPQQKLDFGPKEMSMPSSAFPCWNASFCKGFERLLQVNDRVRIFHFEIVWKPWLLVSINGKSFVSG